MRRRSSKEEWIELLALKDESNMSIKGFCEEAGVAVHSYYYWRKRLREDTPPAASADFVQVKLTNEGGNRNRSTGLVVDLRRMQLRLERDFDETALQRVLAAAGALEC